MTSNPFVYVTYILTTPEKLWTALTSPDFIRQYWFGMTGESDFKKGSPWRLVNSEGKVMDTGEVLESDPPSRLVLKWRNEFRPELKEEGYSRCVFEIAAQEGGSTKLTVTHTIEKSDSKFIAAVSGGWPMVLSNLKSLLEMGKIAVTR